ncbi:MFS transporter [Streptomyces flavofungini]|uniref:MFS transporter n=1 Tax=Streptomyces flavofungini TaxID=68200 RepID=A0ABS0XJY5_9ACTN|nr:MFS transporter [Streptomyces flavofungini]MBJ3813301.1 MFS transporter [Streptomyces flavofungini]GHC91224.1 alpha-ketoglutarate permease [Streptomyces flavofungini]
MLREPVGIDRQDGGGRRTAEGRSLWAATAGSAVETFDWTVYALLVPYFSGQLVAPGAAGTLVSYTGFAVGFLARPLGSVLFGRFGDRRGRRAAMLLSMTVVAAGCFALAALPTADHFGTGSVVLLVLVRIVQGLAVGAENSTVAAYVTETAPPGHRMLYSGISYGGVILGTVLCYLVLAGLLAHFGPQELREGGWRVGFAVGGLLGLAAVLIRRWATESPEFLVCARSDPQDGHGQGSRSWHLVRRNATAVFLMTAGLTSGYYLTITYLPEYVRHTGGSADALGTAAMIAPLLILLAMMAATGALADRVGARPVFRVGLLLTALATVPAYAAVSAQRLPSWIAATLVLACLAGPLATANVFFARLFPVRIRVVAMGLPLTLSIALFGGTLPLLAEALADAGHIHLVPWAVTAATTLSLAATCLVHEPTQSHGDQDLTPAN